jgi:rubrerythrin
VRRRAFLATVGAGAVAAGCGGGGDDDTEDEREDRGDEPRLPGAPDDAATVRFALRLEHVEAELYRRAVETDFFKRSERDLLRAFGEQEAEHVDALTEALRKLGAKAEAPPDVRLPLTGRQAILEAAVRLENLGAAAYLGQVGRIRDRELLATALSIHSVEARHAATLNLLLGKPVTPDGAFARPENMATVLRVAEGFVA